jgi:hypothetical protein
MSAIWNVLPIKKRKQTKKLGNSSNITQHVSASIPRTIFQNKNKNGITQKFKFGLHVTIHRAEGLDRFANNSYIKNRDYNVVYWIKPGEEIHTKVVKGFATPEWNHDNVLVLENLDGKVFLNVEVQRFNSLVDPGTSSGKVVVGRVKIPIPKVFDQRKVGSFHLIRSDEKGLRLEGNILLSMTLQKIKLFC